MNLKSLKAIFAKSKKEPDPAAAEAGGFTLVELLVAMAIASIMLAAVTSLFVSLNKSYTRQNVAADVQQVVRAGVDFMAQSIRLAGLDPDQTGDFDIQTATDTSIVFRADLDLDGTYVPANELITFSLSGVNNDQVQSNLSPGVPLVENVTDLEFQYLDAGGNLVTTPLSILNSADLVALQSIRTVQIVLTVEEPAGRGEPVARTYATEVRCRNLGL